MYVCKYGTLHYPADSPSNNRRSDVIGGLKEAGKWRAARDD